MLRQQPAHVTSDVIDVVPRIEVAQDGLETVPYLDDFASEYRSVELIDEPTKFGDFLAPLDASMLSAGVDPIDQHLRRLGQSDVSHWHIAAIVVLGLLALLLVDAHYLW